MSLSMRSVVGHSVIAILRAWLARPRRRPTARRCPSEVALEHPPCVTSCAASLARSRSCRAACSRAPLRERWYFSGDMLRLAPLQHEAAPSAVELAVVARSADADLFIAACAAEDRGAVDHLNRNRVPGHGPRGLSHGPARNIAAITATTGKARGATWGLRLVSGMTLLSSMMVGSPTKYPGGTTRPGAWRPVPGDPR